jgi:hypothetical protein
VTVSPFTSRLRYPATSFVSWLHKIVILSRDIVHLSHTRLGMARTLSSARDKLPASQPERPERNASADEGENREPDHASGLQDGECRARGDVGHLRERSDRA